MSFHQSVNNFVFHSIKHVRFHAKESVFAGNFTAVLYSKEAHRILVEAYGDHFLLETTCRDWFINFKNNDFDVEDKEHSDALKKFEAKELEALLHGSSCLTQAELAKSLGLDLTTVSKHLKALGMIQKQGHWVSYELKLRDIEWHIVMCEQLLQRQKRKGFLHCIMTRRCPWCSRYRRRKWT